MDIQGVLNKISYGLLVLTVREGEKDNGCIINTLQQVSDRPMQITIAVNKLNYTHDMILRTGRFNASLLTEETPFKVFERFGLQSGREVNKFAECEGAHRAQNGVLYIPKFTNGFISGAVKQSVDLGTHTLFVANVTEAQELSSAPSLTYAYYHEHIKPKPPAKKGWRCKICGYVYEGEELPADFVCPWCKHGIADFEKIV